MAVEGLLAETSAINNFRYRQVEKQPFQGAASNPVIIEFDYYALFNCY